MRGAADAGLEQKVDALTAEVVALREQLGRRD
jgi:hypothetical protein